MKVAGLSEDWPPAAAHEGDKSVVQPAAPRSCLLGVGNTRTTFARPWRPASCHRQTGTGDITMGDTVQSEPVESSAAKKPAPQGIGMAVAYDWGLTVQLLAVPLLPLILPNLARSGIVQLQASMLKLSPVPAALVSFLIALPFAAVFAVFDTVGKLSYENIPHPEYRNRKTRHSPPCPHWCPKRVRTRAVSSGRLSSGSHLLRGQAHLIAQSF